MMERKRSIIELSFMVLPPPLIAILLSAAIAVGVSLIRVSGFSICLDLRCGVPVVPETVIHFKNENLKDDENENIDTILKQPLIKAKEIKDYPRPL